MLALVPAVWHVVDFPDDVDPEFPSVSRPTMSRRPPPAYRLAEPGDTIDRVAIYFSAGAIMFALAGCVLERSKPRVWPAALALALAGYWHASTPGPTFDGWHGMGWRAVFDSTTPLVEKLALGSGALLLAAVVFGSIGVDRENWRAVRDRLKSRGAWPLVIAALVLVVIRQFEIPGVEPLGYWPRWAYTLGMLAFDLALVKLLLGIPVPKFSRRLAITTVGALGWFGLVVGGIWMTWYHRPLSRLKTVEPGKIYMSAMPTKKGLEVAHARHQFKTIINLFPENTHLRSPKLPDELQFAKEHGIRYVGNPAFENEEDESSSFISSTLEIAKDPNAWPILVHCHGCMDRTPAWMGIYRFVVQGRSLGEILQEIERHRGYRPKASVTLLYNRVLPFFAPEKFEADPMSKVLRDAASRLPRPGSGQVRTPAQTPNPESVPRVGSKIGPRACLPSLTPGRPTLEFVVSHPNPQVHESAISS
ncbi:protein tyrosine phosphatase [Singulisphaera sp. PoT]|uniref:protein tyrosine phosphatase n=1 Tax=Singulisphaera sp. PoT TaxID=3411797 RepID=UPI003BF5EFDD